jgi:hypothetical protein
MLYVLKMNSLKSKIFRIKKGEKVTSDVKIIPFLNQATSSRPDFIYSKTSLLWIQIFLDICHWIQKHLQNTVFSLINLLNSQNKLFSLSKKFKTKKIVILSFILLTSKTLTKNLKCCTSSKLC